MSCNYLPEPVSQPNYDRRSRGYSIEVNCRHEFPELSIRMLDESPKKIKSAIINKKTFMTPFEIQVTIPISSANIYRNNGGCSVQEYAVLSIEKAQYIYDAIGRQLKGLKATEPKVKAPKKKPAKKTAKKK